jgi:capsular exopolysaccharide synthesis family protein
MNFFFDALKREAGESVEVADMPKRVEAEIRTAAVTAAAVAPTVARAEVATPKRNAQMSGTPERLVATLKPPVLDGAVVAMEQCRLLRNRVREAMRAKKARSIMLTSATAGEGKTLLSINLAHTLSQLENTHVLLIDADIRRPSLEKTLHITDPTGLTEYLRGEISIEQTVQQLSPKLDVITATATEKSSEYVHSPLMEKLMAQACARYDFVVVDGPPLFPIVDAHVLAGVVDAALLVVRAEHTPYDMAMQCEHIEALRGKIIGAVLNCATKLPNDQYGKYGYGTNGYLQARH